MPQQRLRVASEIFHGLIVVYRDAVVFDPETYAEEALRMADSLIAASGRGPRPAGTNSPATSAAFESAAMRNLTRDNERLIRILRAASERGGQTLH